MAPSLASHHLAVLLRADYVSRWRKGSFVFYSLNPDRVGAVVQGMTRLTRPTGGRNGRAAHVRATEPPATASRLTGSA
jgi:DNA-binding transcriptional ArsR family regulator